MTFDLKSWKNAAADKLHGIGDRLKRRSDDAPLLTYGALCGMSLMPLVEAAGAGQLAPVFMALGNIVGGVGANLVANQIQQWADPDGNVDEAQVARWVAEHSGNTQVIEALDAILGKLDAVEQAKCGMNREDQDWFLNALRGETERIGNLSRYQAVLGGHGLTAQGEHIVQANNHSLAIGTVNGSVTFTTIEHQVSNTLAPPGNFTERARRRYLMQLRHRCNALPLAAMGSDQDTGEDVSLDQVYIDLDTLIRIKVAEKERQGQEIEFEHDVKRSLTALEAATQSPRLVLLGDPGSGKSTFVRQLAARLATACLGEGNVFDGWDTCLLPLLIVLRDLAPRLSSLALDGLAESEQQRRLTGEILDQLASDLDRLDAADLKPDIRDTLIEGKAVLILDGLDEVPEALRELVRRSVHALLHEYPRLQRVIVTCRIRSYSGATVLRDFASHTLAPFDENKIKKFITAWYNAQVSLKRMDGTKAEERSRDLIQATLEEHLREMSSNPMLLTTMAIIHQRDVGLPRERVRLYSQATQVLLNRWQKHKGLISKELEEVLNDSLKLRAVMERLGYEAHRIQSVRGNEADLTRGDILALLEAPEYLKDVRLASSFLDYCDQRAGLLVGRGSKDETHKPREYSFPHRTFQEYLAACHMVRGRVREIAEEYKARAAEGDFWALAAQLGTEELLYNKSRPKEALDLAYALCPDREVRGVSEWREVLWAGQTIAMLGIDALWSDLKKTGNNFEYPERLLDRLVRILEQFKLVTVERIEAGCVLARLGDPRPGVGLRSDNGLPDIVWCDVPAGLFDMGNPKEQANYNDETPQRRIHLPAYRISRYPVTNVQFSAFVRDGGYTEKWCRCWSDAGWRENGGRLSPYNFDNQQYLPNHPVVRVSWYEASAFCGWLTERLRKHGEIGLEQVVRLPRESEWEKAARGSDGRIYPWGEGCDAERTNYAETSINSTSTVGCFPSGASYYGVLDMAGNVWEWCATGWQRCYEDYRDDLDDAENGRRVLRGGSFVDCDVDLRCTVRDREDPYYCGFDVGFRLALAPI